MHRSNLKPSPASLFADAQFPRHPELGFPETATRSPGLQEGQAKSSRVVFKDHLQGAGNHQNVTPANQGSRGEAADLGRNSGVFESAVESRTCCR